MVNQIAECHVLYIWTVMKSALKLWYLGYMEYTAPVLHWLSSLLADVQIKNEMLVLNCAKLYAVSFAVHNSRYLQLLLSFNISA